MTDSKKQTLSIPLSVVTSIDVGRLYREVDQLDAFLQQASIRKPGTTINMPKLSQTLDDFAKQNDINLLDAKSREVAKLFLEEIKNQAPTIHISFASDASPLFVKKLITWLRKEIHPILLLQIGLQPNIAAGCVVRTPDKYFDLSLKHRMEESRSVLITKLREALK